MSRVTIPDVAGMTCRQAGLAYLEAGGGLLLPVPWFTGRDEQGGPEKIPIGRRGKAYADYAVTSDQVRRWRPSSQCGLVTSRASGLLVLDIDHPAEFRAWRLARGLSLPPTAYSRTGRPGGGIHLLFDARDLPAGLWPRQRGIWPGESLGEIKSAGWIAAPPSAHPSGTLYRWERREILPPDDALLALLAERAQLIGAEKERTGSTGAIAGLGEVGEQHFTMLKITTAKVREGWSDQDIVTWGMGLAAVSPSNKSDPWQPEVILRDYVLTARQETARRDRAEAAEALDGESELLSVTQGDGKKSAGSGSGKAAEIVPAPSDPMAVARRYVKRSLRCGVPTLVSWRGDFYQWDGSQWNEADNGVIRNGLYRWLEHAFYLKAQATKTQPDLEPVRERWSPNTVTVNRVLDALAAVVAIPWETEPGMWLDLTGSEFTIPGKPSFKTHNDAGVPARTSSALLSVPALIIPLSSSLLDTKTRILNKPHPSFFNLSSIEFSHLRWIEGVTGTPNTLGFSCPEWDLFLKSLWPDDEDSIRLLRQWFGYILSGDTSRQKIMMLTGPKRSGKGTIARVLRALMTSRNVASPTTESLKDRFGLSSLIGKSLAIISDARFEGWGVQTAVERLLAISGEDAIDVDRKNKPIWNGRLGTRFMIMSNKVPELLDSSGAIASRFLVLQLTSSWLGREDRDLEGRLMAELPGILFWALDGLYDLGDLSQFTVPASAKEAHESMESLSSPHAAFVEEACFRDETAATGCSELYEAWRDWCELNGRRDAGNSARFGRDLRAAAPWVSRRSLGGDGRRVWKYQGIGLRNRAASRKLKAESGS